MDLATEIPPGDVEPECYLKPSTQTFSLKIPTVGEVRNILRKLNGRKAAGLDKIYYHVLIRPYFDSCSSVWGECRVTLRDKLQKLQNRAARVITRSGYDVSAKHLLISLRQDNLTKRREGNRFYENEG